MIRSVQLSDASQVCGIYNEYVANSTVTFEEEPVTPEEMRARIDKITLTYPWIVYEEEGKIIGYSYGRMWRDRSAYKFSVETGTYLRGDSTGRGIGTRLKRELLDQLRERSFHTVISGIALPNPASVALNEKFGFKKIAHLKEVGFKHGKWIDVGYWQLML